MNQKLFCQFNYYEKEHRNLLDLQTTDPGPMRAQFEFILLVTRSPPPPLVPVILTSVCLSIFISLTSSVFGMLLDNIVNKLDKVMLN